VKTVIDRDTFGAVRGIEVRLSRRNLLALLAKLDGQPSNSACTIGSPDIYTPTTVIAEEDDVHYNDPARVAALGSNRPGRMHPDTETAINQVMERTGMSDRDVRSVKDDEEGNAEGYQPATRGVERVEDLPAEDRTLTDARSARVTVHPGPPARSS
jgi:hypothetical protein